MIKPDPSISSTSPTRAETSLEESTDRLMRASLARLTSGVSPSAVVLTYVDWLTSVAMSPGKQATLARKAMDKQLRLAMWAGRSALDAEAAPCIEPLPQDRRFRAPAWQRFPYNLIYQSFLLQQQWWCNATTGLAGLSPHHEQALEFGARQLLDMVSPANFPLLNPQVLDKTLSTGGANLMKGVQQFIDDLQRQMTGQKPAGAEQFLPGQAVALTPGMVIYRNDLIELIQYAPSTDEVHAEPVLIVPAWIMKYYILDLSPDNSLVRYLVGKGHTVFMISWRNPTGEDRDLGLDDYQHLGIMDSLKVIGSVCPGAPVHSVGYCLGGTLLAITGATMARDRDHRLGSMTLLAAQTDFREAGELMLFIDDKQLSFLEDTMWTQGVLDTKQMAGAFQLLSSNDLIWSHLINDYLLGEHRPINDLMAWNADATRMPYRMHSEYLRQLFLDNDLAEGRFKVEGRPITVSDIRVPIFAVGTERDHVAPWRSTYKIHLLADTQEITFLLTSGGHNVGIVCPPTDTRHHFRMATASEGDAYVDPETWLERTPETAGSWWPAWQEWLAAHSGDPQAPPSMGSDDYPPLDDAPGRYVLME
ncbi:polyhydroxyalkanoate synthase [Onishia taeanensis]|uniref:Polyhydroxyalkanoate synthase n=1 Tax=Onishia taeanensis TaxID=284577 RepID=A0A328XSJ8_9GAMM|nr:alpha/beta fold hydrolase [Halomonas taeanensis]RAR62982.1 polyhydroxyalkanoate synthase [Halomonas taeanensis]